MSCMVRILGWAVIVVMKTLSLAAAKTRFSALVEEAVATHEQIVVTRNGEPAVVVLAAEDFGTHRIQADTHNPLPQPQPVEPWLRRFDASAGEHFQYGLQGRAQRAARLAEGWPRPDSAIWVQQEGAITDNREVTRGSISLAGSFVAGVRLVRAAKDQPTYLKVKLLGIRNIVNRSQCLALAGRLDDELAETKQAAGG